MSGTPPEWDRLGRLKASLEGDTRLSKLRGDMEGDRAALDALQPMSETTRLLPHEEPHFQAWIRKNGVQDLDHPSSFYDYRGAFLAGVNRDPRDGHFPDTWKQHGHPTFSVESQYSKGVGDGGMWVGDKFLPSTLQAPLPPIDVEGATVKAGLARQDASAVADRRPLAQKGGEVSAEDPGVANARKLVRQIYQQAGTRRTLPGAVVRDVGTDVLRAGRTIGGFMGLPTDAIDRAVRRNEVEQQAEGIHRGTGFNMARDLGTFAAEFEMGRRIPVVGEEFETTLPRPQGARQILRVSRPGRTIAKIGKEAKGFGAFEAAHSAATGEDFGTGVEHTVSGAATGAAFGLAGAVGSAAIGRLRRLKNSVHGPDVDRPVNTPRRIAGGGGGPIPSFAHEVGHPETAGAPRDQAAVQSGLFGDETLVGNEQTSLLGDNAGRRTVKLQDSKISGEDVGRVKREGAEPEGERPLELDAELPGRRKPAGPFNPDAPLHEQENSVLAMAREIQDGKSAGLQGQQLEDHIAQVIEKYTPESEGTATEMAGQAGVTERIMPPIESLPRKKKYQKMTVDQLLARRHELDDRMQKQALIVGEETHQWVRDDPNMDVGASHAKRSGTSITGTGGRAIGRWKDDARIAREIESELFHHRGVTEEDMKSAFERHQEQQAERQGIEKDDAGGLELYSGVPNPARIRRLLSRMWIGAAAGAGVGAATNDENRAKGALEGALVGGAAGRLSELRGKGARFDAANERGAIGAKGGPGIRSRLVESVQKAKIEKAPAQTWISKLRGQGNSAEEFDWALGDALRKDPKKVWTKAEIEARAKARGFDSMIETVRREQPVDATDAHLTRQAYSHAEAAFETQVSSWDEFLMRALPWAEMSADEKTALMRATREIGSTTGDVGDVLAAHGLPQTQEFLTRAQAYNDSARAYTEARTLYENVDRVADSAPKYGDYVEDGGRNYREILLQLPRASSRRDPELTKGTIFTGSNGARYRIGDWMDDEASILWATNVETGERLPFGHRYVRDQLGLDSGNGTDFQSSHWKEPNVLAHVRLNDRVGPHGEKALHIEEIQSDWHQKGRREGYQEPVPPMPRIRVVGTEYQWVALDEQGHRISEVGKGTVNGIDEARAYLQKYINDRIIEKHAENRYRLPDAPFKETPAWLGLALKRVLDEAIAGKYDMVSWTPGRAQADRYSLRKVADELRYDPETGSLWVLKDGNKVHSGTYRGRELEDVVGKDVANKLLTAPDTSPPYEIKPSTEHEGFYRVVQGDRTWRDGETMADAEDAVRSLEEIDAREGSGLKVLKGQQLEIGGEGMLDFYDRLLPEVLTKYAKKLGADVKVGSIPGQPRDFATLDMDDVRELFTNYRNHGNDAEREAGSYLLDNWRGGRSALKLALSGARARWPVVVAGLEDRLDLVDKRPFPAIAITPELKQAVSKGQHAGVSGLSIMAPIAGAGVGSVVGAASDRDHPTAGAAAGAVAGAFAAWGGVRAMERAAERAEGPRLGASRERGALGSANPNPRPPTSRLEAVEEFDRRVEATGKPSAYDPTAPDYRVQLTKFALDPDGQEAIKRRLLALKKSGDVPAKQVVSWEETGDRAKKIDVDKVLRDPKNKALTGPEALAIRNEYSANDEWLARAYTTLQQVAPQTDAQVKLANDVAMLEARQNSLLARFIPGASEEGRALNALKIMANKTLDPFVWFTKAQRQMGEDGILTNDIKIKIRTYLANQDREGLVHYMATLKEPLTWRDPRWWTTLRKGGLLSATVSPLRSVLGNATRAAYDTASKPATVLADMGLKWLTGRRSTTMGSVAAWKAAARGAREGAADWMRVLRGQVGENVIGDKFEIPHSVNLAPMWGKQPWADAWTKFWFRTQGVADRPFRMAAARRSIYEQAVVIARQVEGLKGQAAKDRIQYLAENPTPEMATIAGFESDAAGFQQRTALSRIASGAKQGAARSGKWVEAGVDLVAPFTKTPAAIASAGFQATPPGGAIAGISGVLKLYRLAAKDDVPQELKDLAQRETARAWGRWSTGMLSAYLGYKLAEKGLMTGARPTEKTKADQFDREGKLPYAVKVNGRWWSLSQLTPLASAMAFGASWLDPDPTVPERTTMQKMAEGTLAAGQAILEAPMLRGVKDVVDASANVKSATKFAGSVAGSFVPSLSGEAARAVDPIVRSPQGFDESIESRIPGMSKKVTPVLDLYGDPVQREPGGAVPRAIQTTIDALGSRPSRTEADPVLAEIARVRADIPDLKRKATESTTEFQERAKKIGTTLRRVHERVLNLPLYENVPDRVEDFVHRYKIDQKPEPLATKIQADVWEDVTSQVRSVVGAKKVFDMGKLVDRVNRVIQRRLRDLGEESVAPEARDSVEIGSATPKSKTIKVLKRDALGRPSEYEVTE